ncbi:MAG: COQ9 family protein [Pseudomonadota bacterium]
MNKPRPDDGFEAVREKTLEAVLNEAAFDGWSDQTLQSAAKSLKIDAGAMELAFPRGVRDALRYYAECRDNDMLAAISATDFAAMKVRDKVRFAIRARIEVMAGEKEAARRAGFYLALPHAAALGAALTARTADTIWRAMGDTSLDVNYYSKRLILSGVYASTLITWFGDESPACERTWAFLDARIENVMGFEKAKARVRKANINLTAPLGALARLRYPHFGFEK